MDTQLNQPPRDDRENGQSRPEPKPEVYKILVDHKPHDWPRPFITGAEIKRLAGVDLATYDAWQDVAGPEDKLIGDNERADLTRPGTEKFYAIKKTTTEG